MNRLTEKDDQGNWALKGIRWQQLYVGQIITKETQEKLYGALHKLLDYEEAGLNPEGNGADKKKEAGSVNAPG